jgi:hypothetical protein
MGEGLLFVYSDSGTVPLAEFSDWYDNEHIPARLAVPGFGSMARYRAADGAQPAWLALYDIKSGVLESPAYKGLAASASVREKTIMSSLATLDRRIFEPISDSGAVEWAEGAAPVVLAVSMSVPASAESDLMAWYADEHIPMLLAVPGWRRIRRYVLTGGTGPRYLALHEVSSKAVFSDPAYLEAVSTPWRGRIVDVAIAVEKRTFALHKAFG